MSAPLLSVFLPPVSAEAAPEHMCHCRPAGVQASMGVAAGARIARGGFGGAARRPTGATALALKLPDLGNNPIADPKYSYPRENYVPRT